MVTIWPLIDSSRDRALPSVIKLSNLQVSFILEIDREELTRLIHLNPSINFIEPLTLMGPYFEHLLKPSTLFDSIYHPFVHLYRLFPKSRPHSKQLFAI